MLRTVIYGSLILAIGVLSAHRLGVFRPASGLAVGEMSSAFGVRAVTGPLAGKTLCYR